ncbi:serine/threonine protein kinase [Rhodobacter sp. SGA-6-6]|uniref:serine/threonine protein kinase n=1 Tax=Rhodobacter sp. SGA-6-6 TaxID=2710882 RepID=UPI0013EA50BB|nr:serine/threonine-protein kinase [Rhodobacter sp. SGA-6-6]NGM46375.1 serine/threonine protein kinase [Rhodobacter sp. SGA-6-6]
MIDALPGDIFHRGQILNNTYEIEGVLGRGGTGEVYRARNLISGRVVAIKALNAQFSGQEGYIELMRREEQMRDIRDDAVVRYTECSRSDQGHVFLVMDYIAGPSIADEMLKRRLEPRELMIIAHRVAEGLVAAHGQGIVHRDLSPDNVILRDGSPEKATIIDFGIAKDTGAGARTIVGNDFAGKYEYAAPEQMEGKAEARSDLYALGALLLAAWKGQVPFAGMTPGEMIRRKQEKLDTAGVPEPLKGLIDWLTEPALPHRAPSAAAVVEQVGKVLKGPAPERATRAAPPTRTPTRHEMVAPKKRGGGGFVVLLLVLLLAAGGGGAWYMGMLDGVKERIAALFEEPLPVVSPYAMAATAGGGLAIPRLTAHAPDEAAAAAIRLGFATLAGAEPEADAVTLADGMPTETWASGAAAAFAAAKGLEGWRIEISDTAAGVSGLAPGTAEAQAIRAALDSWAATYGFTLKTDILAGPKLLDPAVVQQVLDPLGNCGPLSQLDPPSGGYPMGATITVTGDAVASGLGDGITAALEPVIGDRKVQVALNVLNDHLCRVRGALPDLASNSISIWMGQGATGEANLTGVFHTGDFPVVDVLVPASIAEGELWVMAVDTDGSVYNLLPNVNDEENEIARIGVVEGGTRRVRVIFSPDEKRAEPKRIAMQIKDTDYGKSEIIAFVARKDLFDTRRPGQESVASLAEALAAVQAERPGNILGFASRILESRP